MRPFLDRRSLRNRGFQPVQIGIFIFSERLPLALVIVEFRFVHHGDALLHRANLFANATAAARLEIGVVVSIRRDVERRVRTVEPAQRAFRASGEVHHRSHTARRVLLEQLVARWPEAANFSSHRVGIGPALRLTFNRDAISHVIPARQFKLEQLFGIALSRWHINRRKAIESIAR